MQDQGVRLWPPRTVDRLGRVEPRRAIDAGVVLDAIPGLGGQFAKEVPETHLIPRRPAHGTAGDVLAHIDRVRHNPGQFAATHVHCTCGAFAALERPWAACPGGCGRWFMPHGLGARVAGPYPQEEVEDASQAA